MASSRAVAGVVSQSRSACGLLTSRCFVFFCVWFSRLSCVVCLWCCCGARVASPRVVAGVVSQSRSACGLLTSRCFVFFLCLVFLFVVRGVSVVLLRSACGFPTCRGWGGVPVTECVWVAHVPLFRFFFVSGFLVCRAWCVCVCVCACVGFVVLLFCFVLFDLQSMQTAGLLLK